jgi:hypothetical protein
VTAALATFLILLAGAMLPRVGERLVDWLVPPGLNFRIGARLARVAVALAGSDATRDEARDALANIQACAPVRTGVTPIAVVVPVLGRAAASRVMCWERITRWPRNRLAALGNAVNATIGLVAFSWLMLWAVLESIGQSAPMRTASGQYTQAAWVYAAAIFAMLGFVVVLAAVSMASFAGVKWDRRRRWRLMVVEPGSWRELVAKGVRLIGAVVVLSIFHNWLSDSGPNVLVVPGLLGAVIFAMCRAHLGAALSLAALTLGAAAGGGSLLLLQTSLSFVVWAIMAALAVGIGRISARAATVAGSG